jgi:hypothetical protein
MTTQNDAQPAEGSFPGMAVEMLLHGQRSQLGFSVQN